MNAEKITRQSKSNLALAFISLGRERKRDITVFYAFCRVIDDIADSPELHVAEKQSGLAAWRQMLRVAVPGEPSLAGDMRGLIDKYSLSPGMLEEIIAGVEMDLNISRYATFDELRVYCYRVASAVGLVSIEIFGYRNPACKEYAIQLGLALQMTNIIRDVGKDLRNGRIYLPQEDLTRFDYSEAELQDRQSMVAAEIMASVYRGLLRRMELDKFRVFEKEYWLSKLEKAGRIAVQLLKSL
jgi:phytoene synthase